MLRKLLFNKHIKFNVCIIYDNSETQKLVIYSYNTLVFYADILTLRFCLLLDFSKAKANQISFVYF
jgi:hypothetical protein